MQKIRHHLLTSVVITILFLTVQVLAADDCLDLASRLLNDFRPLRTPPKAILPNGAEVPPPGYHGGFYGNSAISPDMIKESGGFTSRGDNASWRLYEHAESVQGNVSAFRGTTNYVSLEDQGAAYWADEGGWVYEIRHVPTWDVNLLLEGRVDAAGGYRGNIMSMESEAAIPAKIPLYCIKKWGKVSTSMAGKLFVPEWDINSFYDHQKCTNYWGIL